MRHILPALVVVATIVASVFFYLEYERDTGSSTNTVLAAGDVAGARQDEIFLVGVVVPIQDAPLMMGNIGKVAEVLVREGDNVSAGQVLARLESADAKVAVAQAEARVSTAKPN